MDDTLQELQIALLKSAVEGIDANAPGNLLDEISSAVALVAEAKRVRTKKLGAIDRARAVLAKWASWKRGTAPQSLVLDDVEDAAGD